VELMEQHFCAHALIPGYSHPSPRGVRDWSVKQMYQFCEAQSARSMGVPLGKLVSAWPIGTMGSRTSPRNTTTENNNDIGKSVSVVLNNCSLPL
jgi:hypothetical protein